MTKWGIRTRPGYVLLSVLWLCIGLVALVTAVSAVGQDALKGSANRQAIVDAQWAVRGCTAIAVATVHREFHLPGLRMEQHLRRWERLDSLVSTLAPVGALACSWTAEPRGVQLDVNAADSATLTRFFVTQGASAAHADSAVAALLSRRPVASSEALREVPALGSLPRALAFLGVGGGAVTLSHAPPEVLIALPGFSAEAVEGVLRVRRSGRTLRSFDDLTQSLPPAARARYQGALHELVASVLLAPIGWTLRAESGSGHPRVHAVHEVEIGLLNGDVGVSRGRLWLE